MSASPAHRHVMVDVENMQRTSKLYISTPVHTSNHAAKGRGVPRLSARDVNIDKSPECVHSVVKPNTELPPVEHIPHCPQYTDDYCDILPMCERLTLEERYRLVNPWSKPYTAPPTPPASPLPAPPVSHQTHYSEEIWCYTLSPGGGDDLMPYMD